VLLLLEKRKNLMQINKLENENKNDKHLKETLKYCMNYIRNVYE